MTRSAWPSAGAKYRAHSPFDLGAFGSEFRLALLGNQIIKLITACNYCKTDVLSLTQERAQVQVKSYTLVMIEPTEEG